MKYLWLPSGLTFPQDQDLLRQRLNDRFFPLDEQSKAYWLEAKYMMAGRPTPYSSIVLFSKNWLDLNSLVQVVRKLEQEYDLPVVLIGANGRGITKPDRSFLLQQVSFLLQEWNEAGEFTVAEEKIEQLIYSLQRLCRSHRSSKSEFVLEAEATIDYEQSNSSIMNLLHKLTSPFLDNKPMFIMSRFLSKDLSAVGKDIVVQLRGYRFLWSNQSQELDKVKKWKRVDAIFYLERINKNKWQHQIVDIQPSLSSQN